MSGRIAIAGATGFVGQELVAALSPSSPVIALNRGGGKRGAQRNVEWRQADFFSVDSLADALAGSRTAVYLVHSMMPTARLDQSRFEDTDLWLADTFGRAAALAGVERIIYLGGLLPKAKRLSLHLRSRAEVESALGAAGVPVLTLRAGLILGAQGSSFQILYLLVKRLPVMLCPRWAWTKTQPIALKDIIGLIQYCLAHPRLAAMPYDVGGPEVTTYRELMLRCGELLGVRRWLLSAPLFAPRLSTLWVCLVTGASRRLVSPLVQSMSHSMVVRDSSLMDRYPQVPLSSESALRQCLSDAEASLGRDTRERKKSRRAERDVRSIQRLRVPRGWTAQQLGAEYFRWVARVVTPWIRLHSPERGRYQFVVRVLKRHWVLLDLKREAGSPAAGVEVFSIGGGILTRGRGRFEFRIAQDVPYALVGLQGFYPRLPWLIYQWTQAVIHQVVMWRFSVWMRGRRG